MSKKIAVIIGSTRPSRIGDQIAKWFVENVSQTPSTNFTIIDLKDINLPFLDEPQIPSTGVYTHEHTKKWQQLIEQFDAYIFVTAEYNAGYPAPLKNAIDYLNKEWSGKPAAIVSYGWSGGASASQQLRQVLERLKMRVNEVNPKLQFGPDTFDDKAQLRDVHASFAQHHSELQAAVDELVQAIS